MWYAEYYKDSSLKGYITREEFYVGVDSVGKILSERNEVVVDSILGEYNDNLSATLQKAAETHLFPMKETDLAQTEKIERMMVLVSNLARAQGNMSGELRRTMENMTQNDSLYRENARLKGQIESRKIVNSFMDDMKKGNGIEFKKDRVR